MIEMTLKNGEVRQYEPDEEVIFIVPASIGAFWQFDSGRPSNVESGYYIAADDSTLHRVTSVRRVEA